MRRIKISALVFVTVLGALAFSSAALADDLPAVSFSDGQYVKLGYAAEPPAVWEAKPMTGTERLFFLGSPVSVGGSYGDTSAWENSNVRQYLNETYLTETFSPDELAIGLLLPYGDSPVYDVTVSGTGGIHTPQIPPSIPPSSAGDSLVWILDIQELQALCNGTPDLPWNEVTGYPQRLSYAAGGPYPTRSIDPDDPSVIWSIHPDGSFSREPATLPVFARPVVSPNTSMMLYKRGAGTQAAPYDICFRWNAAPTASARAGENIITLSFPEGITHNGIWPAPEAWNITDSLGTVYSVIGTVGSQNKITLTVYPALTQNTDAKNMTLSVRYTQSFDDAAQGLNNTKGAILREANPHFGLLEAALETVIEKSGSGDANGEDCKCDVNAGACLCGTKSSPENCGCVEKEREELRITTDTTHYLVHGQPFILGLDAENGKAPYTWKIDGSLPDGLNFSEEGMIEGMPSVAGIFRVTFFVSDVSDSDNAKETSKKFTFLVVEDEKLAIMTDTLPDAQTGIFYTARVRGNGGTKPYEWEIDSLPGWLQLEPSSGILYGMPTGAAIHDLMIRVKDSEGAIETAPLRLSVYPHDGLTVATRVLPAARQGQDYSARLEASKGIPPYFFTLRRGTSLPSGLTLNSAGEISGTPARKGTYNFTVDVMDGNGLQGSASYTAVILNAAERSIEFLVKESETEKRLTLDFCLPIEFNDSPVIGIEALISPDFYIMESSSSVTKEAQGAYKATLTLRAAEQTLSSEAEDWKRVLNELTVEGILVTFEDASGEEIRFGQPMAVKDMRREEEQENPGEEENGGCNVLGMNFAVFLFLALYFPASWAVKGK